MTKTLILFRHAKSSWKENVADHERPLAERGRKAAPVMARWLVARGPGPALALVSTARRTQETWSLAAPLLGKVGKRDVAGLYEATAGRILDAIRSVEPSADTLLVIGHNPGLEDLARRLMRDDGGDAGRRIARKFPTAAVAILSLPVECWTEVEPGTAALEDFMTPTMLKEP